jgi:hypothetical protein
MTTREARATAKAKAKAGLSAAVEMTDFWKGLRSGLPVRGMERKAKATAKARALPQRRSNWACFVVPLRGTLAS